MKRGLLANPEDGLPFSEAPPNTRVSESPHPQPFSRLWSLRHRSEWDRMRLPGWAVDRMEATRPGIGGLPLLAEMRSQLVPLQRFPSYLQDKLEKEHISFPSPPYGWCSHLSDPPQYSTTASQRLKESWMLSCQFLTMFFNRLYLLRIKEITNICTIVCLLPAPALHPRIRASLH